jgi:hypothetical protein
MKDDRKISDELEGKINNIIINSAKPKSLIDDISAVLVKLDNEHNREINPQQLNVLLATSTIKKKYKDTLATNYDLLKQLLLWQSGFYDLSDDIDVGIKNRYLYLWDSPYEIYKLLLESASDLSDSIEISFRVWLNLPLAWNVVELDKFYNATKTTINVLFKNIEGSIRESGEKGIMPFWVFHKDVIGNEHAWEETIHRWQICYYVYEKFNKEKMKKTEIVKYMQKDKSLFPNVDDMPNSIHKLDKLLIEAEQLIESAERGTFPV